MVGVSVQQPMRPLSFFLTITILLSWSDSADSSTLTNTRRKLLFKSKRMTLHGNDKVKKLTDEADVASEQEQRDTASALPGSVWDQKL